MLSFVAVYVHGIVKPLKLELMTRIFSTFCVIITIGINLAVNGAEISTLSFRNGLSLNGKWHYIIDPYETGYYNYRYTPYDEQKNLGAGGGAFFLDTKPKNKTELVEFNFATSPTLWVPGDWNSQDEKLLYYEGTIWYRRDFNYPGSKSGKKVFLHFGAVNYRADVYLNGQKLGTHIGGFTPFSFEVTDLLKETGNFLVVKVDNKRMREAVPTLNTDWWNYGGITRDVRLVETGETYIDRLNITFIDPVTKTIRCEISLKGKDSSVQKVKIEIPALGILKEVITDQSGQAVAQFSSKKIEPWSPTNPKRYTFEVSTSSDRVTEVCGLRHITTKGTDILLNGKPVFLRGICIHEEIPMEGRRAYCEADARTLLTWAKELNCNFVRLAHYPHNEYMAKVAEEMGIMVWEEIPVYWTILWENTETYANAEKQLTEMITRDRNRASVIVWSVGNETPVGPARNKFMSSLAQKARQIDSSRLISAALEVNYWKYGNDTFAIDDPLGEHLDLLSYNEYIGWYGGLPSNCRNVKWKYDYNKPVIISETGGGALAGFYADSLTRWSEEYQAWMYDEQLAMMKKVPQFRGITPWILTDFRSPKRLLPNVQDGWNRKGVIGENGQKKKAWYVLKKFYDEMATK